MSVESVIFEAERSLRQESHRLNEVFEEYINTFQGIDFEVDPKIQSLAIRFFREGQDRLALYLCAGRTCNRVTFALACQTENLASIRNHLERRQDPNKVLLGTSKTALFYACAKGNIEMLKLLLSFGANPKRRVGCESVLTHLSYHLTDKHLDCIKELKVLGVNFSSIDLNENSFLHVAFKRNAPKVIDYLVQEGEDINNLNILGETPLFNITDTPSAPHLIHLFISLGGNLFHRNNEGFDVIQLSEKKGYFHLFKEFYRRKLIQLSFESVDYSFYSEKSRVPDSEVRGFMRRGEFKKQEGDSFCEDFVGENQGTYHTRQLAECLFRKVGDLFHPDFLKIAEIENKAFFKVIWIKSIGHIFGLNGRIAGVNLGGFSEIFAALLLYRSLIRVPYMQGFYKRIAEIISHLVCSSSNRPEIYQRALSNIFKGVPQILSTGWDWHVYYLFYLNTFEFEVNRGAKSKLGSEIIISKVKGQKAHPSFLPNVTHRFNYTESGKAKSYPYRKTMLNMRKITHYSLKPQLASNCTHANLKGVIFIIVSLLNNFPKTNWQEKEFNEVFEKGRPLYKFFTSFHRQYNLDLLLAHAERKDLNREEMEIDLDLLMMIHLKNSERINLLQKRRVVNNIIRMSNILI